MFTKDLDKVRVRVTVYPDVRGGEDDGDQVGEEEGVRHPGPHQGHLRGQSCD